MANTKEVRKQISSIKSTRKITSALEMVAASKIKKTQDLMFGGRPYSEKMNNIILNLSSSVSDIENAPKLLQGTGQEKTHLCVVLTSDRAVSYTHLTLPTNREV